ncbi:MAG TPA: caspase family protein [Acidimicrobiales bacterium]|nr:caspase family protein [Acidimicrobiales bacterium]
MAALVGMSGWGADGVAARVPAPQWAATPSAAANAAGGPGFDALAARLRLPEPAPGPASVAPIAVAEPVTSPVPRDVAIEPPPDFDGAVPASAAVPVGLPPTRYDATVAGPGTWALVIGIDDYPGSRYDLHSAVNDAEEVDRALTKMGVTAGRRAILRNQQADAGTIIGGLDWLSAHAGPGSTMVLFYAGHVRRLRDGHEAFLAADGGVVRDIDVAAMLDRSASSRAWVAVAGCYGGGFDEVVRPGRILTAAAPSDQIAYENDAFGRSYLVEYMVWRGMLGRGLTTVEGAFAWAAAELQRDHPDRMPVEFDQLDGDLDLSSGGARPPGSSSPPPASPPPSTPPPSKPSDGCAALTVDMVRCSS